MFFFNLCHMIASVVYKSIDAFTFNGACNYIEYFKF